MLDFSYVPIEYNSSGFADVLGQTRAVRTQRNVSDKVIHCWKPELLIQSV